MKAKFSASLLIALVAMSALISPADAKNKYRCADLTFEEAQILLKQGHTYLDRDNNGVACENRR